MKALCPVLKFIKNLTSVILFLDCFHLPLYQLSDFIFNCIHFYAEINMFVICLTILRIIVW